MNIPRWSIERPALVLLCTLAVAIWGVVNYFDISRREDPEIKIPTALVISMLPGASAEEVEREVTAPIERAVASLQSLDHQKSQSLANLSVVWVTIDYEADADMEWQKLRSKIQSIAGTLPSTVVGPRVWDSFGDTSAMIVLLQGADPITLKPYAESLRDELLTVPSIAEIDILGEQKEVIWIEGSVEAFQAYELHPLKLATILKARNLQIPAGRIRTQNGILRVETSGKYQALSEIEQTIIDLNKETGQPTYLGDVFKVRRGVEEPLQTALMHNDMPVMALSMTMKKNFNVVTLGRDVEKKLRQFKKRLPQGITVEVVHDSPKQVTNEINNFMNNLFQGLLVVVVCMALLLGLRPALLSAVSIPLSVLYALTLMPIMDVALEKVSIAAFIIALGMLVDNSIIVIDNIDVKMRQGCSRREAAWRGCQELIGPVIIGTLATVVAFFPMLLLTGTIGAYVRSLPLVVGVSLLGSLIFSVTFTPVVAEYVMPQPKEKKKEEAKEGRIARFYRWTISLCLRLRWLVILGFGAAIAGTVGLVLYLGLSFFPMANRDQFTVDIWLKEGSAVEETEQLAREVDQFVRQDPDVRSTLVHVGKGGPRFYITLKPEFQQSNYAQIMVTTKSAQKTEDTVQRIDQALKRKFAGARIFTKQLIMGIPVDAPIEIRLSGPDLDILKNLSEQIQEILRNTPGTENVRDSFGRAVPSLKVEVNTDRANRLGVSNSEVALAFLSSFEGFELTKVQEGDIEIPVKIRLNDHERMLGDQLLELPVPSSITQEHVPLGSIATIEPSWEPGVIEHRQSKRILTILAQNKGRLADQILNEVLPKIEQIALPEGYEIEVGGERESMSKAFGELIKVFFIIVAAITLLLLFQFGGLRETIIILISVPQAIIGAMIGLLCGGYSISFMAFLGVVSLAGMVIKNAVVWMEFVIDARKEGLSIREAVIEAGIKRLRPILLTSVTTIGGLIPLALFGGILFEPMAWSMVVGLALSTVLILILLPVFYSVFFREKKEIAA